MRKKFKKRLLGIILTILMVVSVIPVQQVQPVKAAAGDTIPAGTTIYLRPNAATTWIKDNAVMAFKTSANNKQSEIVVMTKMDDDLTWSGETTAEATNIDFLRLDPNDKHVWNEAGTWPGLERGKNLYTFALHTGVTPTGMWTTYSNTGSETTSYFNVNATLVDYFNNGRVEQPKNTLYNEGNMTGEKNAPYSQLNQWISNLQGYALNGVADSKNDNAPVPLYFGDLLHAKQAGGNLTWYWQGANVAFGPNKETASKDVAQGIVGKNLDDGNLITSYTNENGDPVKVPFFNEDAYPNQSKYMRFYNNLQFPFTKTTNDKGVSTYSFDSAKNTVYYDYDNKKIVRNDDLKIHDASKENSIGYFPFNSTDPNLSAKDNLNYGFGTQFTIPFTVTETGKNVDGSDMEFNFTGDDDVWVYIDGALVLDMGGAHNKAEGKINFATQEATITTGTSNAKLGNSLTVGGRTPAEPNGNTTVKFENIMVKKSGSEPVTLDKYMKESGKVHELKMYYMERGMWNSNMSISYSFVPLPSGLTLSKTLDTTDVNAGLKNAVQGLDNFDFKIQTKNLRKGEANYSDVENLGYTLYDYDDRTFPGQEAKDSTATFSSSYFASDFINTKNKNNSSAFYAGTGFQITESIPQGTKLQYDTSKTRWGVYDSVTSRAAIKTEPGTVATFDMGDAFSSDMDVVNRYVNFVNTPKVGSLSVEKIYEGTAPTDKTFGFTVMVDLTGHEYYDPYKLEYTNGYQTGTTDAKGHFTLKAGEKVTFAGIPAGATYKVVEDAPGAGDTWVQDTSKCTGLTGKIAAEVPSAAVVTNKTKTTKKDYVIYAEAGKTVTYAPNGVTITELTKPNTGDTDIETNVNTNGEGEFTPTSPNKKYDVDYTGIATDKSNFTGKITVYSYAVSDDVYVFDYGLKSDLADTSHGAGMFQNDNLFNQYVTDGTAKFTGLDTAALEQSTITGPTGTALTQLKDDEGNTLPGAKLSGEEKVEFNPTEFMDREETASYKTTVLGKDKTEVKTPEDGVVMSANVTVMPASVVYYEDDFKAKDGTTKIVYTGDTKKEETSPEVDLTQSNGQTEQYGHDDAYATGGNGDSAGSSTAMTSTTDPETNKYATKATFKFKGTGFDVVGRTSTETTTVSYRVKDSTGKVESMGVVDTFYANGDLYQIPVIHVEGLTYTEHTVELVIGESSVSGNEKRNVFYLDGIRIYNPMGKQGDNDYIDNEENVNITKVSDLILGDGTITEKGVTDEVGALITDIDIPGSKAAIMSYNDGDNKLGALGVNVTEGIVEGEATPTDSVIEYLHSGPNNEVYLGSSSALGMVVKATGDTARTLQIEAKAVKTGTTEESNDASMDLKYLTLNKTGDGTEGKTADTVKTATAMYYKIPVEDTISLGNGYYLVAVLGAESEDGSHVLSFTNVKSKGYEIYNALRATSKEAVDKEMAKLYPKLEKYIEFDPYSTEKSPYFVDFKLTGKPAIRRGTWIHYDVTVSKDKVDAAKKDASGKPELVLYFNNKGTLTPVTAYVERAKTNEDGNYVYPIRFKTPNSRGSFALQLYYKDAKTGKQSAEFINAELKVAR